MAGVSYHYPLSHQLILSNSTMQLRCGSIVARIETAQEANRNLGKFAKYKDTAACTFVVFLSLMDLVGDIELMDLKWFQRVAVEDMAGALAECTKHA